MSQIIDGKVYIAPGMILINKKTGKPITEKEYCEVNKNEKTNAFIK